MYLKKFLPSLPCVLLYLTLLYHAVTFLNHRLLHVFPYRIYHNLKITYSTLSYHNISLWFMTCYHTLSIIMVYHFYRYLVISKLTLSFVLIVDFDDDDDEWVSNNRQFI